MDDVVTGRLVLHLMTVAEAERVVAGVPGGADRWADGYPHEGDVLGAEGLLGRCASGESPGAFGNYEIRRRADGMAIGGIGFNGPPERDGSVTVGYALVPSARGSGYASEALRGLLDLARARGVPRVQGDADLDNVASQHVMAAAGMRQVGQDDRVKYYEITWPAPSDDPIAPGPVALGYTVPGPAACGPATPGSAAPAPAAPGPVAPGPAAPDPAAPGPTALGPVVPASAVPGPTGPAPAAPGPTTLGPAAPGPAAPGPAVPDPAAPGLAAPDPTAPAPPGSTAPGSPIPRPAAPS